MKFICGLGIFSTILPHLNSSGRQLRSRFALHFVIFLILFVCISGCLSTPLASSSNETVSTNSSIVFTDSTNKSFSFPHPAERIVTVNADTVETLIVLGAGNKIIGVTDNVAKNPQFMNHLPNAKNIGDSGNPNIELISLLHPDVVVVMNSAPDGLKSRLRSMNFTLAVFDCYILSDVQSSVRELGVMTSRRQEAERYLLFFKRYDSLITTRIGNMSADRQPSVYFEIGSDYTASGKGSGGSSLLRHIKAINIADDLPTPWPKVSPEWIVNNNPEVIIKTVHTYAGDEKAFPELYDGIRTRKGFSGVRAIKKERVYVMSSNILYGPRGIIAQLYLAKTFYPEKFRDINPDEVLREYSTEFLPWPEGETPIYTCDWCVKKDDASK